MSNVQEQLGSAVESAREAAAKVGEQVSDFFQGNPFGTPVGKKIELATDATQLATENWGLNVEICDFININEENAKDAIRAIRKRLHTQMSKNNAIVMYTLTVLETCVKNCGHRFHMLVCSKDFILDLVKLIGPKFDAPQVVQERVLSLIQAWADTFRGQPDLVGVCQVYDDLKSKGVEFPATDLDKLAPILTPKRTVFTQPQPTPDAHPISSIPTHAPADVVPMTERLTAIDPNPEQLAKLRGDVDVVNSNLKVLREMLTEITPAKANPDELGLINEIHASCKQMQQRILDLIRVISNEGVTYELLVVNDEFNSVFEKYDRWMANRTSDEGKQKEGDLIDIGESSGTSLANQLNSLSVAQAKPSSSVDNAYAANTDPVAEVGLQAATKQRTEEIPSDKEAAEMSAWIASQEKAKEAGEQSKKNDDNDKL